MTDETCGVDTADGSPCQNPACRSDGRCWIHTETEESADVGRDSKLTRERQEEIAQAIENGKSITSAARMAGVSRNAIYDWMERGETQDEGIFAEFHDRLVRAKGHGEDFYFNLALELARENEDHRFIASLMKQRYPDSWAESEDSPGVNDSPGAVINLPDSVTKKWQRQ